MSISSSNRTVSSSRVNINSALATGLQEIAIRLHKRCEFIARMKDAKTRAAFVRFVRPRISHGPLPITRLK